MKTLVEKLGALEANGVEGDEKQLGVEQPLPKHLQPELVEEARLLALERGHGHLTAHQCSEAIRLKQKGQPLFHVIRTEKISTATAQG